MSDAGRNDQEDEFPGSVIVHLTQHLWPFDRGRLVVGPTAVTCRRRGAQWSLSRDDVPIEVARYRLFPLMRTVVWIEPPNRLGFVPSRSNAVLRSLEAHGWPVRMLTLSWISWLPSRRRVEGRA